MSSPTTSKWVTVQFNQLKVINDQDGWFAGAGDIYMNFQISNGDTAVADNTLPGKQSNGEPTTWSLNDGDSVYSMGGPHARFLTNTSSIRVQVQVWDDDAFLTFDDDRLASDLGATYYRTSNYGAGTHVHRAQDYELTYTITAVDA